MARKFNFMCDKMNLFCYFLSFYVCPVESSLLLYFLLDWFLSFIRIYRKLLPLACNPQMNGFLLFLLSPIWYLSFGFLQVIHSKKLRRESIDSHPREKLPVEIQVINMDATTPWQPSPLTIALGHQDLGVINLPQ